jgi:hypothetical protein
MEETFQYVSIAIEQARYNLADGQVRIARVPIPSNRLITIKAIASGPIEQWCMVSLNTDIVNASIQWKGKNATIGQTGSTFGVPYLYVLTVHEELIHSSGKVEFGGITASGESTVRAGWRANRLDVVHMPISGFTVYGNDDQGGGCDVSLSWT